MKTSMTATLRRPIALIVGLSVMIAGSDQHGAEAAAVQTARRPQTQGEHTADPRPQERQRRERAMDRIVHIEEGIILEIPQVPRLCDGMAIRKGEIDIGDCNLYCEQEGQGIPLVLINGGPGGTHHCFHPHFSLAKDFARVIYYDQRGCGLSDYEPGSGYTVDQAVNDLDRLRQILGIDQWAVLGFSYGGLLAQCYATKYPHKVKGLVLVGSSMGLLDLSSSSRDQEFISQQEREKLRQIGSTPGLSEAQHVYNRHLNGDWKRQHYYRPSREDIARGALYEWVHDKNFRDSICPSENKVDLEGAFERCPIPTLILEGKWDMSWSADKPQRLHKNHPNSKLVLFEEAAHSVFEDEPEAFFAELRQFLSRLPKISDKELASWKKHLAQHEEEKKHVKIPEGEMTEQEKAAIEEFYRLKAHIEKGRKYVDASIPLRSLLSLISGCANRDMEAVNRVRVSQDQSEGRNFDFESRKNWYGSLQIFRAPPPPKDAEEGNLWVIYTKEPDTGRLADGHFFVLRKGSWMHCGNMGGNPRAVLKWHDYVDMIKKRLPTPKDKE
jgi:proline iminopeptidase